MGRLADAWGTLLGNERKNVLNTTAFIDLLQRIGLKSKSGINVTVDVALGVPTVFACLRALAEGVSQIPFRLIINDDEKRTKKIAVDHPAHKVISRRPNEEMNSFEFREIMTYHAALTGNAFAFKTMVRGKLSALYVIPPGNVKIITGPTRKIVYEISDYNGIIGKFTRDEIFHIRGPMWDGARGMDVVHLARESIGLAVATEENHAFLHANGSKVDGVLTTDKTLDDASLERIAMLWNNVSQKKFGTRVLDMNLKYERMAMSGVDSEHIKTREHQIQEICRAFGVFPIMVGFADKTATFASAEQFFIQHVVLSLGPWYKRWEENCAIQLISEAEQDSGYQFRLYPAAIVRGDLKTRFTTYQIGVLTGIMTRNEARLMEDWEPLPDLDEPLVPLNMGIAGQPLPDDTGAGPGGGQNVPGGFLPNIQIAPKSLVDAWTKSMMGHSGPSLVDAINDGRRNIGRVISAKNERKIREASASIADADSKLVDVLSDLDKKEPEEDK